MSQEHIHRILGIMGDPEFPIVSDEFWLRHGYDTSYFHFGFWKNTYKDVGKRVCVLAFVPYLHQAFEISQKLEFNPFTQSFYLPDYFEPAESLQQKIRLVEEWASHPSRETRTRLRMIVPQNLFADSFLGERICAVNFINSLVIIISTKGDFAKYLPSCFFDLWKMGFDRKTVDDNFKATVIYHFREKLKAVT